MRHSASSSTDITNPVKLGNNKRARDSMKTVCRKLTRLVDIIRTKGSLRQGYVLFPSTDSVLPELPPLPELPGLPVFELPTSSVETSTITTNATETGQWVDFQPLVNLIQYPSDHPAWHEGPFVRGAPSATLSCGRRWSYPAFVHAAGGDMQLLAALNKPFHQARYIECLGAQLAERHEMVRERDEMIRERDETIREKNTMICQRQQSEEEPSEHRIMKYLKALLSSLAAKKDIAALHERFAETESIVAEKSAQIDQLHQMLVTSFNIIHRYHEQRLRAELSDVVETRNAGDVAEDEDEGAGSDDVSLCAQAWFVETTALIERMVERL